MEDKPISKRQLKRIQTLWGLAYKHIGESGPAGDSRKLRLAWIGLKIGREIGSCNELTRAEAKVAIDAIQKLLPPDAVRSARPGRDISRALGTEGRAGASPAKKEIKLPDAGTMQLLQNLLFDLGWDRARLDAFLHSPKSPVRHEIRTLADANKVIWSLKSMLRRRNRAESAGTRSDRGNGGEDPGAARRHDRAHV